MTQERKKIVFDNSVERKEGFSFDEITDKKIQLSGFQISKEELGRVIGCHFSEREINRYIPSETY